MFTLTAMPVEFVALLVLFSFTSLWELRRLAAARTPATVVSRGLHLAMSLLMLAMVPHQLWMPLHTALGLPVLLGVMVLGVVWFLVSALRSTGHARAHAAGCAGMFAAMVWHLWAMQVHMTHSMAMSMPPMAGMDHSSMEGMGSMGTMAGTGGTDWMTTTSRPGGVMWWFAVAGVVFVAGLLWLAVRDLTRVVHEPGHRLGHLAGAAMDLGMAWMSTGLLVPVLPWMAALSF